jgi:membrane protein
MGDRNREENRKEHEHGGKPSPRKPQKFSKPGWKNVLKYTKESITNDHLSIVAPGVAFYLMLGMIPALAALMSIYGLVADPADVQEHFAAVEGAIPAEAGSLLGEQMNRIAEEQTTAGWGAFLGIALALWAGSRAALALMEGLNIVYDEEETRGFIMKALVRVGLTLAAVLLGLVAIGVIVVLPPVLNALPFSEGVITLLSLIRWPLLLLVGILALAVLYRFAPSRKQPKFRWLSWGSATAAILWVAASAAFSFYVARFGDFNETYGALGAVVILLMWLLISAFVILLGAEVDAAFEMQTEKEVLPKERARGGGAQHDQAA